MNYEEFHRAFTAAVSARNFRDLSHYLQSFLTDANLLLRDPQTIDYLIWIVEVLIQHRQLVEAEMVLSVACESVVDEVDFSEAFYRRQLTIYNLRGQVLYQLGRYCQAKVWFENLKVQTQKRHGKKSRESINALTTLALTHEAVNELSQAAKHYDEALALARDLLPGTDSFRMWILAKLKQLVEFGELCSICYRRLPNAGLACTFCTQKGLPAMNAIYFQDNQ